MSLSNNDLNQSKSLIELMKNNETIANFPCENVVKKSLNETIISQK